jgi:2-phosphosulfolactate phosphatase
MVSVKSIDVHFLPTLVPSEALSGSVAVIIDILRASSTIATALQNGARRMFPCGTPEEAFELRRQFSDSRPPAPDALVLGGEREGIRISGFDLGNSPAEYGVEVVSGRSLAFTTTNGTRALLAAEAAAEIVIGSFLNITALSQRLVTRGRPIHLICAGTNGHITGEDVLFAGAIVATLSGDGQPRGDGRQRDAVQATLGDSARIAQGYWNSVAQGESSRDELSRRVNQALSLSHGGRNLATLGYDADITLCSAIDAVKVVPQFDRHQRCLVVAQASGRA